MSDELVERLTMLRAGLQSLPNSTANAEAICTEAATTITRLTEEVAAQARVLRDVAALPLIPEMARETETPWGILTLEERCDMIARNRERHDAAILAARALTGGPHEH